MPDTPEKHLLLTIGTGDIELLRESLIDPAKKSIRTGAFNRIWLLPSRDTEKNARIIAEEMRLEFDQNRRKVAIEVHPLEQSVDENDADACFNHFYDLILALRDDGARPADITPDFTRGTKAMSAGLVAAALLHGLPKLRYLTSKKRDNRGMVTVGSEVVTDFRTDKALLAARLDLALHLFRTCNFRSVSLVLPRVSDKNTGAGVKAILSLAEFYAAWDAHDYVRAAAMDLPARFPGAAGFAALRPENAVINWVRDLARPCPDNPAAHEARYRALALEMLASGRRRLDAGLVEEALVRAFRTTEFTAYSRLAHHGILPRSRPDNNDTLQDLKPRKTANGGWHRLPRDLSRWPDKELERLHSAIEAFDGKDSYPPRPPVLLVLRALKDPVAEFIERCDNLFDRQGKYRHQALIIHGIAARVLPDNLNNMYNDLESLVARHLRPDETELKCAYFLNMLRETSP